MGEAIVAQAARLANVTLDDKYTETSGRVYLNGMQALTRLTIMQRQRDAAAGLNTAGYVTGYRGSPLGGLDQAMMAAKRHLEEHNIKFQPGVNEDLAATAVWGTQQLDLFGDNKYDGVFSMWYGKGPGVDRSGDVFPPRQSCGRGKTWRRAGAWRATITRRNPRPQRTRPNMPSWITASRSSTRRTSRNSSITDSMAGRRRAIPAAGSP
jgi:hypothetical protein